MDPRFITKVVKKEPITQQAIELLFANKWDQVARKVVHKRKTSMNPHTKARLIEASDN